MELTSSMFGDGQPIPERYTKEGDNISPPLSWTNVPENTQEFALICEDIDAIGLNGPFVHWLVYSIPADQEELEEGLPNAELIDTTVNAKQGRNSFSELGYGGPQPPTRSGTHRYVFTLYALDHRLDLHPALEKAAVLDAIERHITAKAQVTGTYEHASSANIVVDHQMTG